MQVGDKVRVINKNSSLYGKEVIILNIVRGHLIHDDFYYVQTEDLLNTTVLYETDLEPITKPFDKITLELTQEEWQALRDLLKMKANLELLESLEKRIK